ncbi:CC_3452 family protein [Sphingomonas sp. LaA6.9]|uniref:CC_3452 family protein n=1 Tax=Sphingomonas sp. LaA6.9 TaxID=2919914 RepID=UPI001F4F37B6|nr:hypothetical protein [Sphingomonas sp. LaA6.9]MCJ8155813.1 hypothetical protein [Sphingomonas sp. LaA6.9]
MRLAASLILLASPVAAMAASAPGTATINHGTPLPERVIVGNNFWSCAEGACRGPGDDRRVAVERACRDLAKRIGAVDAITVGSTVLDQTQLAACNKDARGKS